ncbi:hypothetical protein TNCV_3905771 [Trichonephila clavipes]|nr:hypothetical protein TNCV_3905771 [Trichonephila clavipes]
MYYGTIEPRKTSHRIPGSHPYGAVGWQYLHRKLTVVSTISGLSCWMQSKGRTRLDSGQKASEKFHRSGNFSSKHSSKIMRELKSRCPPMSLCT